MKKVEKPDSGMSAQEMQWQKSVAAEKDLRALLDRDYSAGLMNNTKWSELANAFFGLRLMFTIQFIDVKEPLTAGGFQSVPPRHWDSAVGPFLTLSIEWLEIDPIRYDPPLGHLLKPRQTDCTAEVEALLQQIGIPYHLQNGHFRITGHLRNNAQK